MNKKKNTGKLSKEIIDELRSEVNEFDKSFGIKLKKINPYGEPEAVFDDYLESFQEYLLAIIYEINGIHGEMYLTKKKHVSTLSENLDFSDISVLNWNSNELYNVNSYMFRCRFLTSFLIYYLNRLEKMAIRKYDVLSKFKTGKYENGYFYMQAIANDTRRLIQVMLSGNSYSNILLQVNQNCSYIKSKKTDPKELNKYIRDIRYELKSGLKYSLFIDKSMSEDIAIDSILKLAYLLSTGDTDLRGALPRFREIEGADTTYELRGLIEALGAAIMEERRYDKRPIMYRAYMDANPYITSKYKDINQNWFLSVGVRSLEYVKFFCNDKYISKFIDKMLHN